MGVETWKRCFLLLLIFISIGFVFLCYYGERNVSLVSQFIALTGRERISRRNVSHGFSLHVKPRVHVHDNNSISVKPRVHVHGNNSIHLNLHVYVPVNKSSAANPIIQLWDKLTTRFHGFTGCSCECNYINTKEYQPKADLVLIPVTSIENRKFPGVERGRNPHQLWVFVSNEPPRTLHQLYARSATHTSGHSLEGVFNLSMTYMPGADIGIPYGGYTNRTTAHTRTTFDAASKSRMVLWYVRNCHPKLRRDYAIELRKYIEIDVFGQCSGRKDPCKLNQTCLEKFRGRFKFYLAFENSLCKDYITEKFWEALKHGMVPIAMGADIEDYRRFAPPNSFLHVDNFTSPGHLADYLQYLDVNPDVYNSYHAWRERWEMKESGGWWWWYLKRNYEVGEEGMWCRVCEAAHKLRGQKNRRFSFSDDWSREKLCREPDHLKYNVPQILHTGWSGLKNEHSTPNITIAV